jgi:hypothetical protein
MAVFAERHPEMGYRRGKWNSNFLRLHRQALVPTRGSERTIKRITTVQRAQGIGGHANRITGEKAVKRCGPTGLFRDLEVNSTGCTPLWW